MSFRIIVDSGANIPAEQVKKYDIDVISFIVTVNGREQVCFDPDMTFEEEKSAGKVYYDAMRNGADVSTSLLNCYQFSEAFKPILENGDDILCINLSGNISGTYNEACRAAGELKEQYSERKIEVVDAKNASLGQGLLAVYASIMRSEGKAFDEIVKTIRSYVPRMNGVFTVDDLKYLAKTGRIKKSTALAGNVLNIKPILRGNSDGFIVEFKKIRGRKRVLDELLSLIVNNIVNPSEQIFGIAHADAYEEACALGEKVKQKTGVKEVMITNYDFCTGSHVGPDTVAVFFIAKDRELAG